MRESIKPSKRLLAILIIPLCFTIFSIYIPTFSGVSKVLNLIIIAFALIDLTLLFSARRIVIATPTQIKMNINNKFNIDFKISNTSNADIKFKLGLDLPRGMQVSSHNQYISLSKQNEINTTLGITPYRRGEFKIETIHLKLFNSLNLFSLYIKENKEINCTVQPDFSGIKEYMKLTRSNRLFQMGIHNNRYKGSGTELESLREYNRDDDSKFIDWKATARINRTVTKQFQMESQNDIVIVLDCGRLMCGEQKKITTLDHGINGVLTLSYVIKSLGDSLRIIAFSDRIEGDLKSLKGGNFMNKVISFLNPLQPRFTESNYELVFDYLRETTSKRSLLIFISDIMDDINYTMFKNNFLYMNRQHHVLFILLRDTILEHEAFKKLENSSDQYRLSVAREMYVSRAATIEKLKHNKLDVLDILPTELSGKVIDHYLNLKSKNYI